MSGADWLACTDASVMLACLRGRGSARQLQLFGVACCRRMWHHLTAESQHALELIERFAEGEVNREELDAATSAAWNIEDLTKAHTELGAAVAVACLLSSAQMLADDYLRGLFKDGVWTSVIAAATTATINVPRAEQALLLRDIFGNPFRPVPVDHVWSTSEAVAIAQRMYEKREFDCMATLADALEKAGCKNTDILNHCRQVGAHVRGCWVVDIVLRKK